MNVSTAVARIYAQSLIDIGVDQNNLGRIVDDLGGVRKLFDEDRDFREFFSSPRLDPAAKKRVLNEAFKGKLDRPVLGLLHVLVDKRRELVLDNIVDEFERYRDLREGVLHAHVTSAAPLGADQRGELEAQLAKATGKKIRLHERVEPKVLGGLLVRLGDKVIDGTLRRRLDGLRRTLVQRD